MHDGLTERLLGRWRLLRADRGLEFSPGVVLDFRTGHQLVYSFEVGPRRQSLPLRWRAEGNELHTESATSSHEATAHISFGAGDALVVDFGGRRAWFVRELGADRRRR